MSADVWRSGRRSVRERAEHAREREEIEREGGEIESNPLTQCSSSIVLKTLHGELLRKCEELCVLLCVLLCDLSDSVARSRGEAEVPALGRHRERRSVTNATPSASRADVGSGTIAIREKVADPPALVVLSPTKRRLGVSYGSSVPVKAL